MAIKRILTALTVLLAGVVGVVVFLALTGAPSVQSHEGESTVELAFIEVPVASADPILVDPDTFAGEPGPHPEFDTSGLGQNLSFEMRPSGEIEPLKPTEARTAVYLGHDVDGEPYFLYQTASEGILDFIGQIVADFGSVGRLETSYGSLMTGPSIFDDADPQPDGRPTGMLSSSSGEPIELVAEWHSLPKDVSVVVFYIGEDTLGWQTPVSSTVALATTVTAVQVEGNETRMVALNAAGADVASFTLFSAQTMAHFGDFEPPGSTTPGS